MTNSNNTAICLLGDARLVAISRGKVIAYQWCARESQAAWGALFKRLPEPVVVVCDGGPGMHAALKEHWPGARVQRCLVHLQRNVRKYVTTRSKTAAGKPGFTDEPGVLNALK